MRIAAVLTAPLFLILLLFLANTANPMAIAFLNTFEVVNQTEQPVIVTTIGTVGDQGRRRTLLLPVSGEFSWPKIKTGRFRIPPGSSQTFHYD